MGIRLTRIQYLFQSLSYRVGNLSEENARWMRGTYCIPTSVHSKPSLRNILIVFAKVGAHPLNKGVMGEHEIDWINESVYLERRH